MLVFALLNSLVNKVFYIEVYIFLLATILILSRNYEKE